MADTVVSDAVRFPQDEGLPNIADGNETWDSAGLVMLLAQAVDSDSYVRSDAELDFAGHDGTNDTVDVQAGVAYLDLTGETVDVQSGLGGSIPPTYDTTLPTLPAICVVAPSATTVPLQDSTASDVWLAYATDGTVTGVSAGEVYLRSDDTGSVTAPPHPSVQLGSANPDNAGADTLTNRHSAPTFQTGSVDHSRLGGLQSDNHHTQSGFEYSIQTDGSSSLFSGSPGDTVDRDGGTAARLDTDQYIDYTSSHTISGVQAVGIDAETFSRTFEVRDAGTGDVLLSASSSGTYHLSSSADTIRVINVDSGGTMDIREVYIFGVF